MSNPAQHHKINYVEFTTTDIERTKKFYSTVFGWSFKDWGPDYIDCNPSSSGVAIGFAKGAAQQENPKSAPLIVLYSADLKATEAAIVAAGGSRLSCRTVSRNPRCHERNSVPLTKNCGV